MTLLAGRRGLVVGVSSERSLGFHCVKRLLSDGAEVACTYRPSHRRPELIDRLTQMGCRHALPLEVSEPGSIETTLQQLGAAWGRLDFVVHTLVHVPQGVLREPLTSLGRETFADVLAVGVHSLVELCRHATPLLAASDSASVVTLTSESSHLATPNYHVVGISKAALEAAVRYLAFELGPQGITVNAVSAPAIPTAGADAAVGAEVMSRTQAHVGKHNMTRRPVSEDDAAAAVAFLASPMARQVTGQVLVVDGGYSGLYV